MDAQDRTLGNLEGRKSEDLKFLLDQRGERKMTMGSLSKRRRRKLRLRL